MRRFTNYWKEIGGMVAQYLFSTGLRGLELRRAWKREMRSLLDTKYGKGK